MWSQEFRLPERKASLPQQELEEGVALNKHFTTRQLAPFGLLVVSAFATGACSPTVQSPDSSTQLLLEMLDQDGNDTLDPYEAMDAILALEQERDGELIVLSELDELAASWKQQQLDEINEMFETLDSDENGQVELSEMDEEMLGFASLLDANGDGVITPEEAMSFEGGEEFFMTAEDIDSEVQGTFEEFDRNHDDQIVADEAGAEWPSILESDFNRDGAATSEEMHAFLLADNSPATFEVSGDVARMSGVIGADTPARVLRLIFEHPEVRTLDMVQVPGSIDDVANLRAASYVRAHGFTTVLRSTSTVASGGTDLFLAGKRRIVEPGARLGIHSWGGPGYQGKDVPRDDPQHQLYLEYYREMDIPEEFYWRTLEAAPANDIHWMTETEVAEFHVRTEGSN